MQRCTTESDSYFQILRCAKQHKTCNGEIATQAVVGNIVDSVACDLC
jgi:hypothetical protein